MKQEDQINHYFDMAVKFATQTSRHIFLTGKAGTGKTTFLRHIKNTCHKKMAVVAPTGVAAINAGGTTIHSFFQIPIGNFVPDENFQNEEGIFFNRRGMLRHLRLSGAKRILMQELELLIIDEVSMVRADLLDAIDAVLRYVRRRRDLPFGGVQMLYIGDLFQLPPVVNEQTWEVLRKYYSSPFFFNARALQQDPPLYLELKKIYRQSDEDFIRILNNLRNNQADQKDIDLLNTYYRPDFKPEEKGEYIILTTHNYRADQINKKELEKLPGELFSFPAKIEKEFNEKSSPADTLLSLKAGAQIMFIRNDTETGLYYNGKIGTISRIEEEENIYVSFPGEDTELKVKKETWRNVRYTFNTEADQIEEEVLGTFEQFPIRLAWAITIHKSQGLTFSKAIIDAGNAFAPGQVYVALSRLTSLDGLVLHSRINAGAISTDQEAIAYSATEKEEDTIKEQLKADQKNYIHDMLLRAFNWERQKTSIETFQTDLEDRKIPEPEDAKKVLAEILLKWKEQEVTAEKFSAQLQSLLLSAESTGYGKVHERVDAAAKYFKQALSDEILIPLEKHYGRMKSMPRVKTYLNDLRRLTDELRNKMNHLDQITKLAAGLTLGKDSQALLDQLAHDKKQFLPQISEQMQEEKPAKQKLPKGASHRTSLQMFREGKSVQEIAAERGLAAGTIESHLIHFIMEGELDLHSIVSPEKSQAIEAALIAAGEASLSVLKEKLGKDFSYAEIRAVTGHLKKLKEV